MNKDLKIAMVTYRFPPTFAGGARQAIELAKALRIEGVESFFIGANLENALEYEIYEGFPLYRIKTKEKKRINYLIFALGVCKKLFAKRKDFDIVHFHSIRPFYFLIVFLAKILRKPIVLSLTLIGHDDPLSLKNKSFLMKVESEIYKFYNKIICSSTAITNSCTKFGLSPSVIASIPCAISCGDSNSLFRPAHSHEEIRQLKKDLFLPLDSFIVTFVGHIQIRKGSDLLFEAWEELLRKEQFDGYLLLVGPYNMRVYDTVSNNDAEKNFRLKLEFFLERNSEKRIIFTGNVNHAEVAKYLRISDCFVFPSKREGFGMVVIEAMASGLPVICTLIPQITTDMIDNERDGIILDKRDPSELSDAILRIKEDRNFQKKLSYNAIQKVSEKFSIHRVVSKHIKLYCDLIGKKQRCGREKLDRDKRDKAALK